MDVTARDTRKVIGKRKLREPGCVGTLLQSLQEYPAPGTMDAVYRGAAQFSFFRISARAVGEYFVKFDSMRPGGAFPDAFAAALCSQNANPPYHEESPILASAHGKLATAESAQQARRLLGPIGAPAKRDVCMVGDGDSPPEKAEGQESRRAYRAAQNE